MSKFSISLCVLLCAVQVQAQLSSKKEDELQPELSKYRSASPTMTEEQVAELMTEYTDDSSGRIYKFTAGFAQMRLDPKKDKSKITKYQKSGEVPFRLTCELTETKEYKGKMLSKRVDGTARIYILDSEGKVIDKKSTSLSVLCPG